MPSRKLCHILDANHCKCLMVMIQDWLEIPDVDQIDSGAAFYVWDTRLLCIQRIIHQYNVSNNCTCFFVWNYKFWNKITKLTHVKLKKACKISQFFGLLN